MARWIDQPDMEDAPRPLRDAADPWGLTFLRLKEVMQCSMGNILFLQEVKPLLLTWLHGGAVSLEHPKGPANMDQAWPIWFSAFLI